MSIINATPLLAAAGGDYQISRSVRLRSSASAYFNRTQSAPTSSQKATWSVWLKRGRTNTLYDTIYAGSTGSAASGDLMGFLNNAGNQFRIFFTGGTNADLITTQVFRDFSAWYHFVISVDTTQATASNRIRIYVNGVQITAFSTANYPSLNYNMAQLFANGNVNRIGYNPDTSEYFDGYMTEFHGVDGQALTPSSFGETDSITGVWKPKKYAGTYGTNGFYLNFSDNSSNTATTIGKDYSGNGNNWTPNNISVTAGVTYDSMLDVPTLYADGGNGRGNYAVLNAASIGADATLSAGNLQIAYGSSATINATMGTIGMASGKWYWEVTITASSLAATGAMIGITNNPSASAVSQYPGYSSNGWAYHGNNGSKYTNASGSSYGSTYGVNDVIGISFDADTRELIFYKNGTSQGVAFTGLAAGDYFPAVGDGSAGNTFTAAFNFGQRPFAYTPPTGFKALNTQNLPEPTIKKGNQYFDVSLYTGTGSTQSIVNNGAMQPDFVWVKSRNNSSNNGLFDAVRGGSKPLISELTDAEYTGTYISSFNSNGFTIGATASSALNASTYTYVGWQWKESPSAGFDIVTYTGNGSTQNIAHSLGVAPRMMIVKKRSTTGNWPVYHASLGNATSPFLNLTNAANSQPNLWNSTTPTSSVFSVGTDGETNANGATLVAYLFAEIAGYSKFGSYTGNGSADGTFVFLGFRPAFVMIKATSAAGYNWTIEDSARSTYNASDKLLYPSLSNAENSGTARNDFLSNGFKARDSSNNNVSGVTYIYAAFAENPFKNSLAR